MINFDFNRITVKLTCMFLGIMTLVGCGDDNPAVTFIVPTDLSVEINVHTDGSGKVDVVASANNAFRYELYSGEALDDEPLVSSSGQFTYIYSATGTYSLEIRALANSSDFINEINEIEVTVDEGTIPGLGIPTSGYTTPTSYAGMDLLWQDEFDASSLNTTDWTFEMGTGNNGWGNNELQYYREENTFLQEGFLVIEAKEEPFGGRNYTSSRIITQNKFDFLYGRVDIRAVMPEGKGLWPALWMLGANFSSVGWPQCGEIDIMEMIGGGANDSQVHGTAHWANSSNQLTSLSGSRNLTSGKLIDEFHVYSMIWEENSITWFIDDVQYHTINTSSSEMDEFRENFFFIFNVAVGGNWPGSPNSTTVFPQRMIVDYVRVFQNQ